jgi:acetyl-CoA carboxylase carboxyltransferase component
MTDSEEGAARTALEELRLRRQVSAQAGSREVAAGRLSARDRISKLLDEGSFEELGRLAGYGEYEVDGQLRRFTPSNCVIGQGSIDARPLMVVADDASSRGGSSELAVAEKWIYAERMALTFRMPLVRMVDTAGGSVKRVERAGRTQIPGYPLWPSTALMSAVPVVSVAFGACVGLGAVRVIGAHFSVMVKDQAQVFAAGPPVIKQGLGQDVDKETLGGWRLCTETSGIVRNAAEDEDDALAQARRFLSYLPENAWQIPPHQPCTDPVNRCDAALNQAIPENPRRVYMAPQIVAAIADRGSLFELAPGFGASVRTYLARLDGYAVGLMINDPCVMGGALTRAAAQKTEQFVDLCDSFHLPVINLVDQPGVMIGVEAERAGTLLAAARAGAAIEQASVPWISIVLRRAFGVAGSMLGPWNGPDGTSLNHRFAWPSARWGSIPIEGGVAAAYKREIAAAPDPAAHRAELEARYQRLASPLRTAEAFGVVDVIEPAESRPLLCRWVRDAYRLLARDPQPRRRGMR